MNRNALLMSAAAMALSACAADIEPLNRSSYLHCSDHLSFTLFFHTE